MAEFVKEFILCILKVVEVYWKGLFLSCRKENKKAVMDVEHNVEQPPDNPWEGFGWAEEQVDQLPVGNQTNFSKEELCDRIKEESVYVVREQHESVMYGKVTLNGSNIHVHSSEPIKPDGNPLLIPFRELLSVFREARNFPIKAFLQIGNEFTVQGDVVIATCRSSARASNFLLLCSGIKNISYKGKTLKRNCNIVGTVSSEEVAAVVGGITDGGVYEAPVQKGVVCGCWCKHPDNLSRFNIWMENPLVRVTTKFGYVEEGMETLERLFKDNASYQIKDCGLILRCSKTTETTKNVVPLQSVDSVPLPVPLPLPVSLPLLVPLPLPVPLSLPPPVYAEVQQANLNFNLFD